MILNKRLFCCKEASNKRRENVENEAKNCHYVFDWGGKSREYF
jgi:hypothetical protein